MSDADETSDSFLREVARAPAVPIVTVPRDLAGGRFEILERLGEGGFGVVHRARDAHDGSLVALKILRLSDADRLYRFKREFRSLADISHPNLAQLFELHVDGERAFLTMELVQGVDLVTWVRPGGNLDETRLRASFPQLAAGLAALHRAGKLHRDVKPSNVLVTEAGRVVILDFGLVADLASGVFESTAVALAGTPAYLAPELIDGAAPTAACDWYSVGATLFQALTGTLPFSGATMLALLFAKREQEAPRAGSIVPVPEDLDALCRSLLVRDPARRGGGRAVLALAGTQGGGTAAASSRALAPAPNADRAPFIGRARELDALETALQHSRERAVALQIHGTSGIGKTTLVEHFAEEARARFDTVVLAGRCYDRESVPYKALDGVIDALSRHLMKLGPDARTLLPRGVSAISRLFPVLDRCDEVKNAPTPAGGADEPHALRQRAVAALKELLARLADRAPLIVWIDDVQWADAEGAALLREVLEPPDPPALLLLLTHRREQGSNANAVEAALPAAIRAPEIALSPLSPAEAEELARTMLAGGAGAGAQAAEIASEAEGNPFLVAELSRIAESPGPANTKIRLRDAVAARLAGLPGPARGVLEVLAVARGPVERGVALRAAGAPSSGTEAITGLRGASLVRTSGTRDEDSIDAFHDRIRQALVAELSPARLAACHVALARELEATGRAAPERIAEHWLAAGEREPAARWTRLGAEAATRALAFERAASLYARAVELSAPDWTLTAAFARALGDAGKNEESAAQWLHAAELAPVEERADLQLRAADRLFLAARVEQGLATAQRAHRALGLKLPSSRTAVRLSGLVSAATLRVRGLRLDTGASDEAREIARRRSDAYWGLAMGLNQFAVERAADAVARSALDALRAGDAFRAGRALALHGCYAATKRRDGAWASTLVQTSREIAARTNDPYLSAVVSWSESAADWFHGLVRSARDKGDRALDWLDTPGHHGCAAAHFERATVRVIALNAQLWSGDLEDVGRRLARIRASAGIDLYTRMRLLVAVADYGMANDLTVPAREEIAETLGALGGNAPQVPHRQALLALARMDFYEGGAGAAALRRFEGVDLRSRFVAGPPIYRAALVCTRALAAAAANGAAAIAEVERDARLLRAEQGTFSHALGRLVSAAAVHARGSREAAIEELRGAATELEAAELGVYAAAARRRLADLVGGDEGKSGADAANRWMASRGIRNPARMTDAFAPGFGPRS